MFYKLAKTWQSPFHSFSLFPPASDKEAWSALNKDWKAGTQKAGNSHLHYAYPPILASDFLDFTKTGNRVRYEDKYFARRRALDALVLAQCLEEQENYLNDIVNGIFCICEESGWQLPAHNSYIRDTPQLPLPDSGAPVLDLFACETGSILAATLYLLGDKLDAFSPFIRKRITCELTHRIFTPYLERHFWWMGNGDEPMNNWTIWCTQNILIAVFLTSTDEDLKRKVFRKACKSVDYFLADYGEDGCCDEGALYYRHAGLCLFNTMEILNHVTGGHFASLYQAPKIKNIASYIMNVHIRDKYYLNFADCSPVAGRCSAREFLFGSRTENENLMTFAANDFIAGMPQTLLLPEENNLYYRVQNAFSVNEILSYAACHKTPVSYPNMYYPSTGLFIARDDVYFLAAKAGDNGDSHNHNDTGSFIVYKDGLPVLIDVGVESYTQKTFSPQRYEIWTMQSAYHNLPTVSGYMQKDGESYKAQGTDIFFSDDLCEIQMDIAPAYPKDAGLRDYVRKVSLSKGAGISISDTFSFQETSLSHKKNEVILSLMTYEKPVLNGSAFSDSDNLSKEGSDELLFQIGQIAALYISGAKYLKTECIPITDPRLKTAWEHEIYRILIKAADKRIQIRIR